MISVKGGALSNTKKLTVEKTASLAKNLSARKPKTKSPAIKSSKHTKPNSVTKVSVKVGALASIKKLIAGKIASLV